MIPGDLLSAFPHRQFHTLPGLLDSWASLPNSNPNACVPMQGSSLYHFYDGLWYDPAERRTHDLPCECLKSRVVCGTVYGDMHHKDLLGSIARVKYCILIPHFYPVMHDLRKKQSYKLINQLIINDKGHIAMKPACCIGSFGHIRMPTTPNFNVFGLI